MFRTHSKNKQTVNLCTWCSVYDTGVAIPCRYTTPVVYTV